MMHLPTSTNNDQTASFARGEPIENARAEQLAAVLDEYLQQLESGGVPPDLERLVERYPELELDLRECAGSLQLLHRMAAEVRPASAESLPASPKRIGDFEIIRELGRGGMGVVYEARQVSLDRRVALKVLPFAAVLESNQIARFRNEAQAAASLHHPNIVPVYGVGDERGVHFFAMQFVSGQSLDHALAELGQFAADGTSEPDTAAVDPHRTTVHRGFSTRVSTRTRSYCESVVRLAVQAAEALQHAHECGVVHRDIKPSNLMVDRDGKLWVTDFGLARMESSPGVTMSGDVVGTLRYMSPEQARGNRVPLDARTDIYSLGVTIYEMLTLTHALRAETRHELLDAIENLEPVSPRRLNPSIPYDLETIVLKAMAKNRDDRYATVGELAEDLQRFLNGEGALARRPSMGDHLTRWAMKRRKTVSAVAAGVALVAVLSTAGWVKISREEKRTADALAASEAYRVRAEQHFRQAREVVDRFSIRLSDELAAMPETGPVRRRLLEDALDYYHAFIEQAGGDATLARDLASTLHKAGLAADRLGDSATAQTHYRDALQQYARLTSADSGEVALLQRNAECANQLGLSLAASGEFEEAAEAYLTALALAGRIPEKADSKVAHAELLSNWGMLDAQTGDVAAATRRLGEAIKHLESLVSEFPDRVIYKQRLAGTYNNLSYIQRKRDWNAALAANARAVEILEAISESDATNSAAAHELAVCLNNRGAIQSHLGDWPAAVASHKRAVDLLERLVRIEPSVVDHRRNLAVNLNNLAQALAETDESETASTTFDHAERVAVELVEDYPKSVAFRNLLAGVLNNRAMQAEAERDWDTAMAGYASAIEYQRAAFQAAPQVDTYREHLSKHLANYGRSLRRRNRFSEAAKVALERRDLWNDNGNHLLSVARELAVLSSQAGTKQDEAGRQTSAELKREALATLELAEKAGLDMDMELPHNADDRWNWLFAAAQLATSD